MLSLQQLGQTMNTLITQKTDNTSLLAPQKNTSTQKTQSYGEQRHRGLGSLPQETSSTKLNGANSLSELQSLTEAPTGGDLKKAVQAWKNKHAHSTEFLNTTTAASALSELYEIYDQSNLSMGEFLGEVQAQGADELIGKMAGLTAFRMISGLESVEYIARAVESDHGADAMYNSLQATLKMGSKLAPVPVKLAFIFTSELLKVKEGRGLVHKYYAEPMSQSTGYKLAQKGDISYKEPMFGSSEMQNMGARLEKLESGFETLDSALDFIKAQQGGLWGSEDYAVTQEIDGSYSVMDLNSTWFFGDDMNNASVLNNVIIRNDNPHNIVALVAEDGSYGTVQRNGVYEETGYPRWSVDIKGKL